MISDSQCWYFKSPKQTRPYPKGSRPYFDSSAPHICTHYATQATISSVKQSKPMLLTYREETKQPRRPQAFLLLEFFPALECWSDIYTGPTSCLIVTPCLHRTRTARQNTIELIIVSDAVYTGCGVARHDKSPTVSCCRILFITYWHKFQMIFNGHFVASSVDRL